MIRLTPEAEAQVEDLMRHYERLERPAATRNLVAALEHASDRITDAGEAGLPAPRPYPSLTRFGFRWIKVGAYWIAFEIANVPIIVGVFYESSDIPGRI